MSPVFTPTPTKEGGQSLESQRKFEISLKWKARKWMENTKYKILTVFFFNLKKWTMKKFWKLMGCFFVLFFVLPSVWRYVQFLVTIIIAISVFFALKKMLNNRKAHLQTKNSINGNEKAVKAKVWSLGVYLIAVWGLRTRLTLERWRLHDNKPYAPLNVKPTHGRRGKRSQEDLQLDFIVKLSAQKTVACQIPFSSG